MISMWSSLFRQAAKPDLATFLSVVSDPVHLEKNEAMLTRITLPRDDRIFLDKQSQRVLRSGNRF